MDTDLICHTTDGTYSFKCYGHLKILTVANSFLQEALTLEPLRRKKDRKPFAVDMVNYVIKGIQATFYQMLPFVKKSVSFSMRGRKYSVYLNDQSLILLL